MARVYMLKETRIYPSGGWQLCFQWCRYELDDGVQFGYRFIWRRPDGDLQAARGQARIPSIAHAKALMDKATAEGWGDRDGDAIKSAEEKLRTSGLDVDLRAAYVGWRNKEASDKGHLTAETAEAGRIIHDWA
jgi:hypothetical protein